MPPKIDLASTLTTWFFRQMEGVHTAMPATIEEYDPKTRMAKIIPGLKYRGITGATVELKPITNVPVIFPSTSTWEISAPLVKGDTGLMLCSEASLGVWLAGKGDQVAPEDSTRFSLHDAVFIVGLYPTSKVPEAHDGLWIRYKNTSMNLTESEIKVKGNLIVEGKIEATEEVAAMALTPATMVKLSTHLHGTGVGPTTPPQVGT